VISCDNLSDNGLLLKQAVVDLAKARGEHDFAAWIEGEARFPRTMVDSITPATDDALRDGVAHVLGLQDAWPVQREAFTQWVIEDLGLDGPDWASVGVTLAPEVTPYEQAKLRLLNGAHSTLAYAGLLAGFETVADTMADPALAGFVRRLMIDDIVPTLARPPEFDLEGYGEAILQRFRNPHIRHKLAQIAWDGSQKLSVRLLGTMADALAAGRPIERLAVPVAAWMHFVRLRAAVGVALTDPLAEQLSAIGRACSGDADADVPRFLALTSVFPRSLAQAPAFSEAVTRAYARIAKQGIQAALLA
jgi:fructuronate reductase